MLEACPQGQRPGTVRGQAFCIEHEAEHRLVRISLGLGQPVHDLQGRRVPYSDPRIQRIILETLANSPHNFERYERMEKTGRNYPEDTLLKGTTLEQLRVSAEKQAKLPIADLSHACMGNAAAGCGT